MPRRTTRKSSVPQPAQACTTLGRGQLTLVEHALCPLDTRVSLVPNLVHETSYQFTDPARRRQTARARVLCPLGLSPHDEFYLWGLLALTCQQPQPSADFQATPHYCLRALGLIDAQSRRGGRQYQQFAAALERLSAVRYVCDQFYDPVRAEHRRVTFGLLSYSLPVTDNSDRAWRFCWDALFFEFASAAGGAMRFDLGLYRSLTPAARRLLLLVSKVFARSRVTPRLKLHQLAVDVLGLAPSLAAKHQLSKLRRACAELTEHEVLSRAEPVDIRKLKPGHYEVLLTRGSYFQRPQPALRPAAESPLVELLRTIGVGDSTIPKIVQAFPTPVVQEWADITLAAKERFGAKFFTRSAAAYFLDNVKQSASAGRTPPEWWHDVRRAEQLAQADRDRRRRQLGSSSRNADTSLTAAADVLTALKLKFN